MKLNQWYDQGETLLVQGRNIFYRRSANTEAPVLLLIHGFPTSSWDWAKIWPSLTERFQVIALDLLGFGHSEKPSKHNYCLIEQADLVEALLTALGVKSCHLLAHDYGDSIAQELLARQHERETSLVYLSACLLNGGLFPEAHRTLLIQKLMISPVGWLVNRFSSRAQFKRSFSKVFAYASRPSDEELNQHWENLCLGGGRYQLYKLMNYILDRRVYRDRWLAALQHATVPLALINGSVDPVSGAHLVQRYRTLACRLDFLAEFSNVGHYPQLEAPELTLAAFFAFHQQV